MAPEPSSAKPVKARKVADVRRRSSRRLAAAARAKSRAVSKQKPVTNTGKKEISSADKSTFDFLGLPTELRNIIYEHTVPWSRIELTYKPRKTSFCFTVKEYIPGMSKKWLWPKFSHRSMWDLTCTPTLYLVNHQVKIEVQEIISSEVVLSVPVALKQSQAMKRASNGPRLRKSARKGNFYLEDSLFWPLANFGTVRLEMVPNNYGYWWPHSKSMAELPKCVLQVMQSKWSKDVPKRLMINFGAKRYTGMSLRHALMNFIHGLEKNLPCAGVNISIAYKDSSTPFSAPEPNLLLETIRSISQRHGLLLHTNI